MRFNHSGSGSDDGLDSFFLVSGGTNIEGPGMLLCDFTSLGGSGKRV